MTGQVVDTANRTVNVGEYSLTVRDILPGDMAAVLALHTQVFGPEVDAQWFAWKYGPAPEQTHTEGRGQAIGAWHGNALIAFCGGLPRTLWRRNKSLRGMQIGDVMVHPAWRGILTRRGAFFHVSQRFYDSRLGLERTHPFQLGFGFPNARHLRLAVMLGLLRDGGAMESLHWSTSPAAAIGLPWYWRWQALDPSEAGFDSAVDSAWKSMLAQAGELTLGRRDSAYLRWRYVERPQAVNTPTNAPPRYRFFGLRRPWRASFVGVAVLDLRSTSAHWLDWVGPMQPMPLASAACRLEAARNGATELVAWASPSVAGLLERSGIERRAVCAGLGIPTSSDLNPQDMPRLQWWLMGGDTDFL